MVERRQPTSERRQQIAEAALKILSTQGVHRLTAMELAREVGIADGTIFRHFKDKAEIVDAAIDQLSELLGEDFPAAIEDPVDRLQEFFIRRLQRVRKHPVLFRLAFSDRLEEAAGEESGAKVRRMVARSQDFVRTCLTEARLHGLIDDAIPVAALTLMVLGTLQATALVVSSTNKGPELTPEVMWDALERLLRGSAGPRRPHR